MPKKIDLKKELKHLYQPSAKEPVILDVPEMAFLMRDGAGNPNTNPDYQATVEALYSVSYTLKFLSKKRLGRDYVVMPLEGLWWGTPMGQHAFTEADKAKFKWTMMITQPEHITNAMMEEAIGEVRRKKDLENLDALRFTRFKEGTAVQILYFGPYNDEGPTVDRMHQYAFDRGYQLRGKHHEIYLNDPRRTAPEKLKTVLRHPVKKS
ncbi:MAG: GyrI-like domain-containing protein [Brevefilum sp.]